MDQERVEVVSLVEELPKPQPPTPGLTADDIIIKRDGKKGDNEEVAVVLWDVIPLVVLLYNRITHGKII